MLKRIAAVLLVGVAMGGCATTSSQFVKEGQQYGVTKGVFHGRWWNYYERGASFLAGDFYQEAEADLKEAIRGRDRDTWSARTYGLHFVEYFPNRELGVAYYHLGRLDEAETFLNTSLQQIDTARAHDYLDLVKRAKLQKGQLSDISAPAVETTIKDGTLVASRDLSLGIHASDDLAVAEVRVNGRPLHQRGSAAELTFDDALVLDEGVHALQIDASDLSGKESKQSINVKVDLTGPAIGIFEPPASLVTDAASVHLRGACSDRNGVAVVQLGETVLARSENANRLEFESDLPLKDGENTFVAIAKDQAGNETRAAVSVYKGKPQRLVSFLLNLPDRLLEPLRFAHVRFLEPVNVPPRVRFAAAATGATPAEPVQIELKFPKESGEYHKKDLRITGRAVAQTKVENLTINKENFELISAPVVEFSKRIPVAQGENLIVVAAQDDQGRSTAKDVKVIGRQVEIETPESKMSVSVLAFGGAADEANRQALRAQTESQIVQGQRFNVVDRTQLAAVLQEQQLSAALSDPDRALQLGKVIPANVFLVGEVIERGPALEIYTRVISTETSRIVATLDAHVEDKNNREKLDFAIDGIANGLSKTFPRVPGELVQVQGKTLVANLGKEDGVRDGMYLLVVHQTDPIKDPSTGEVLIEGEYVPVGKARITTVSDKASKAETVEFKTEGEVKLAAGMPTITM